MVIPQWSLGVCTRMKNKKLHSWLSSDLSLIGFTSSLRGPILGLRAPRMARTASAASFGYGFIIMGAHPEGWAPSLIPKYCVRACLHPSGGRRNATFLMFFENSKMKRVYTTELCRSFLLCVNAAHLYKRICAFMISWPEMGTARSHVLPS